MSQQKGGNNEPDYGFLFLIAAMLGVIFAVYHFFHTQIAHFTLYFKYYELKTLDFFFPNDSYSDLIDRIFYDEKVNAANITFQQIRYVSSFIGNSLLWPLSILGVLISGILYFFHPSSSYKEIETTD